MHFPDDVRRAELRIRPWVRETPIERVHARTRGRSFLKLENQQETGSFKLRGALSFVSGLDEDERAKGVVTASSGNHGLGVAHSLSTLGVAGTVVLPRNAAPNKVARIEAYGVDVQFHGEDCVEAETFARALASERDMHFASPYNDPHVVAGQGTIGLELARQVDRIDRIYVAMGGGGLISGIAATLKSLRWNVHVVGCSPARSPVLHESLQAGHVVERESLPTLSDGTAGGMEPGSITLALAQEFVDESVLVDEDEIARAMRWCYEHHGAWVEGAAGVALAAWLRDGGEDDRTDVVVVCGGNVSPEAARAVLDAGGTPSGQ